MRLWTQVDHWKSPLLAVYWITEKNCLISLWGPSSRGWQNALGGPSP